MSFKLSVDTPADIPKTIDILTQSGAEHRAVLLRALWEGRIAHWEAQRTGSCRMAKLFLAQVSKPALVLIGDDDDHPTGPSGWPVTARLFRWARQIVLHGAGAKLGEYQAAVVATQVVGRFVLVECGARHLPEWVEAANRYAPTAAKIAIRAKDDRHPIPHAGAVH